jgi:hypothetical protein
VHRGGTCLRSFEREPAVTLLDTHIRFISDSGAEADGSTAGASI